MKKLRKYANMAFLLLSVATIVPTYANLDDDYREFKAQIIQQSTRPEMVKKAFKAGEIIYEATSTTLIMYWIAGGILMVIHPEAIKKNSSWIPIINCEYLYTKLTQIKKS